MPNVLINCIIVSGAPQAGRNRLLSQYTMSPPNIASARAQAIVLLLFLTKRMASSS